MLIAAALAAGALRAGYGLYRNRKEGKRKRSLLQEAYKNASERLGSRQGDIRQSQMESLNQRGLLQGGDERIDPTTEANTVGRGHAAAINANPSVAKALGYKAGAPEPAAAAVRTPRTLAGSQRADLENEFGMEWRDLDMQRQHAKSDIKSAGQQGVVDSLAAGVDTGMSVYSIGKTGSAIKDAMMTQNGAKLDALPTALPGVSQTPGGGPSSPKLSPIAQAMGGIENPSNWFGGIHGLDPLSAPGSSWNRGGTKLGVGQMNAEFNV